MKNREFDIIFTFYGNDEGTIYGLVYKNTDCFLPINEYCWKAKNTKQFIADIMLNLQDKIIDESLILHSQEKKEGSFQLKAWKWPSTLYLTIKGTPIYMCIIKNWTRPSDKELHLCF